MKITLLHYAAPPIIGGVESVLGHHARLLAGDGQTVSILAGRGAQTDPHIPFISLPLADSRHPEVEAVKAELDAGRVTPRFTALVSAILEALTRLLKDTEVLVVHNACSLNKNLALTAAIHEYAARPGAPRLVLWHHDLAWATPRYQAELHPGYPWDLLRTAWPGAVQVTISESRRQELAWMFNLPTAQIQVIPNGVDVGQFFKLEAESLDLLHRLDLLQASPLLLLPVRITPRKNIELALRSLAALKAHFPAACLLVTGPLGPHNPANTAYFQRLLNLRAELGIEESAVFLVEQVEHDLPDAVIADCYRLADALFLPSREEGFGIPMLEAGLAGLPIFCADIPPLRSLGGSFATYFSPDADPAQVAALVQQRLAAEPTFGLRQQVKQGYTWQRIYEQKIKPLIIGSTRRMAVPPAAGR